MDQSSKDEDQESARYEELADKVEELNRERASLEQRVRDLEMRVTGSSGKDEMTYNFIVEKQTTQMQWSRDRESPGSPKSPGKDSVYFGNKNVVTYSPDESRNPSFISASSETRQPPKGAVLKIEQLANNEQHPRAVFGENGELFIIYSPTGSTTKVPDADGGSDDGNQTGGLRRGEVQPEALAPANETQATKTVPVNLEHTDQFDQSRSAQQQGMTKEHTGQYDQSRSAQQQGMAKEFSDQPPGQYDQSRVGQQQPMARVYSEYPPGQYDQSRIGQQQGMTKGYSDYPPGQYDQSRAGQQQGMTRGYSDYPPGQYDQSRAGQQQGMTRVYSNYPPGRYDHTKRAGQHEVTTDREPNLPQVIVVTGLRHSDLKHDRRECLDDEGSCQCYQIMKESEEWKANVTQLLELLVMNAYGSRCPKSLLKALMEPSTREQAIAELLDRTFPASDNTVSQDNITKKHQQDTSVSSLLIKNKGGNRSAIDNKKDSLGGVPRTFSQYPPYPPASFESKESLPRHAQIRQAASSNRTTTQTTTQQAGASHASKTATQTTTQQSGASHANKIDIVCPPGSRPVIHIPPSGMPGVTCNLPRAQDPSIVECCSPKNPCPKHR